MFGRLNRPHPRALMMVHRHGVRAGLALVVAFVASIPAATAPSARAASVTPQFAVGELTIGFVDPSRLVRLPGRRPQPRPIVTVIRYPAAGPPSNTDVPNAPAATTPGGFPLVVFAHGFDSTPAVYATLLQQWAHAGYVVAAPIFPLTNSRTPGGADESDIVEQPTDMSFVITRLLHASATGRGRLARLINPHAIAVAGHSDGGSTALAVVHNRHFLDRRVDAAIILSGARIPGLGGYDLSAAGPPLMAAQGTADTSNAPVSTYSYFSLLRQPKFLLTLWGASHLAPYTTDTVHRAVVTKVTIAFLDRYLKHLPGATGRMWAAGSRAGVATLSSGG